MCQSMFKLFAVIGFIAISLGNAWAKPPTLLALGDSLTAGYGLEPTEAMPVKLQSALQAGYPELKIINAGVSGDTAADGLSRVDWALTDEVTAVLVELGANDALRGLDVAQTEAALDAILAKVKARDLPILLLGMKAPPNLGAQYQSQFEAIFPRLAAKYNALLYPFYLDGVAADRNLNQPDGIHPNAKGVEVIVARLAPKVKELLAK